MALRRVVVCLLLFAMAGCGRKHSSVDVARGQKALMAALDSWKNNEPPDRLQSLQDPIDYKDEMRLSHRLLDYTVGKPDAADPEVIRYPVTLKLQAKKGQPFDRTIVFMVALKSPIVIARDPYE